jgi:hypothetical protein
MAGMTFLFHSLIVKIRVKAPSFLTGFTFPRFLKSPEISDYIDYETITQIRNALKNQGNLCNHLLKSP